MSTQKITPYKSAFESLEIDLLLQKVKENVYNKGEVDSKVSEAHETLMEYIMTTYAEIDAKIAEKVAEIVAGAPEDFDTLKELSDWLMSHEDSAASMNTAILKNTADVATKMDKSDIVTLTQAEYDALTEKTAPFYFIRESDGV